MTIRTRVSCWVQIAFLMLPLACTIAAQSQQTLGGVTGTVTDSSGASLPGAAVTLVGDQTTLTRTQQTDAAGAYTFVNLPIGTYTLTFKHDAFESQKVPSITVQANRTVTLNMGLKVGAVTTEVTVTETPLVNAVDTTNGYILDKAQIDTIPLPTGSFTGLAILSPGVNAELPSGTGANSGLGNQPIWANGQRDTSNTFLLNGVDAKNLFNGKSTSQVASGRVGNNTGISASNATTTGSEVQSSASPYLAIGQALPTPAPETIQELRVNTSMYDAQQGSTSGAHIDMSTASGTNTLHGQIYGHRGTDWLNAAPFFYNQDPNIPQDQKVPELHRYTAGGTLGGALIKNKLFGFISYQHIHDADEEIGISRMTVPFDFTPANCGGPNRTAGPVATCLANISNTNFFSTIDPTLPYGTAPNAINPIALATFLYKLPNGQYLIPWNDGNTPTQNFPENAIVPGTAYFYANQTVGDIDWIVNPKDTLALKYYYQQDPTTAPYAYSSVPGFTQHLDAGSQVATITNTQVITNNFNVAEVFGFIREKIYSTVGQPFTPSQFASFVESSTGASPAQSTINTFGSNFFPGITIYNMLGYGPENVNNVSTAQTNIGQGAASQGANTGVFQNRFMPSANAIWLWGKHTLSFGGSFSHTQLDTRDNRPGTGTIGEADLSQFLQGFLTPYTSDGFVFSSVLQGNANRYYRANETGEYIQDKFQFRSNLSLTLGLRWDYNGGLSEKYGRIYNFDPSLYNYNSSTDTLVSNGIIVAGNNAQFPTKGISNSTLTGRQWGFAPRVGLAWSPKEFHDKIVVRAGWGMYYDRGELYTYLSPGFAAGVVTAGPFGVNQTPPFVAPQSCTASTFYQGYIPTCDPTASGLTNPWGTSLGPPPTGNPASINNYLPNTGTPGVGIAQGIIDGESLFSFADYNRANKLPYTINQTLDIQWQPRNDLAIEIGYVGNLGRHQVIPLPFNQAGIASPTNPIRKGTPFEQDYTYGYTVQQASSCSPGCPINLPNGSPMQFNYEGGNVDLRVPYLGYSSESESYTAAGVSAYNALQAHVEKRLGHGFQAGFSYTYSHSLDEQSAMGLFYNGNNPLNLKSGYGNSDFDRTHVINFTYHYSLPKFFTESSLKGKIADGWAFQGITVLQSGQPYSVIDYTGAVGSIYYSVNNGITNPIVPLAPGCTPKNALTGLTGAYGTAADPQFALKASCFTLPLLNPGDMNGAIPGGDTFETNFVSNGLRNVFRQPWQRRADISLAKMTALTERVSMKYTFDVFNLTNTPSFDIPQDNITQNQFYNPTPVLGTPALPTGCTGNSSNSTNGSFFNCPFNLGSVNKTIGSSRQIQMSLAFMF
jgi:hypothetical protein